MKQATRSQAKNLRLKKLYPISPDGRHMMFGYYDRCPWSPDLRYHLALGIPQQDHYPRPEEVAEIGLIDCTDNCRYQAIGTTSAWNPQQGSMTLWLPQEPGRFVVNDREGDHVFSRVLDISGREIRRLPRPVYNLSPDGRHACTINFARLQRRGYAYPVSNPADHGACGIPDDDGVWIMDVRDGSAKLVCSYTQMAALHPEPHDMEDAFCFVDHPAFNCDGSRLYVLFRYLLPTKPDGWRDWKTYLFTVGIDGSHLRLRLPHVWWKCTHQNWGRQPDEIVVDQNLRQKGGEFLAFKDNDEPLRFHLLAPGAVQQGHHTFSPDQRWLLVDSYPDREHLQYLRLFDVETGRAIELAAMRHPRGTTPEQVELRCDLHPRWRPDGKVISFDSIHDGWRRIWLAELE